MKVLIHFVSNSAMLEIRDILNIDISLKDNNVRYATTGERSLQIFGVKLVDYQLSNYFNNTALMLHFNNHCLNIDFDNITDFIIES